MNENDNVSLNGEEPAAAEEIEERDIFITETDPVYNMIESIKTYVVMFIILSLLACFGFFISWITFLFFEAIVIISVTGAAIITSRKDHCRLEFIGDRLNITYFKTGASYEVFDVLYTDFIIKQTRKEKKFDYCSFLIKNTIFGFGGVKNYTGLMEHMRKNFYIPQK